MRCKRRNIAALAAVCASALLSLWPASAWAAGGGEHHGMDWLVFAGSVVNFIILVFLFVRYGGPGLADFLVTRKTSIERDMDEARVLRDEAHAKLEEIKAKSARLDEEREALLEEYRQRGEEEKARIIAEARRQASRIEAGARASMRSELSQARHALEREIVERAMAGAEAELRAQLDAKQQQALVERYITELAEDVGSQQAVH